MSKEYHDWICNIDPNGTTHWIDTDGGTYDQTTCGTDFMYNSVDGSIYKTVPGKLVDNPFDCNAPQVYGPVIN